MWIACEKSCFILSFSFKNESELTSTEITKLKILLGYLQSANFETFLNQTFPGLFADDDILGLMKLMTSRSPGSRSNGFERPRFGWCVATSNDQT